MIAALERANGYVSAACHELKCSRKHFYVKLKEFTTVREAMEEIAMYLVDCHKADKDMDAIRVWYAADTWSKDNPTENEERKYVWGLLKTESKLRSIIKANNPHKAEVARDVTEETTGRD